MISPADWVDRGKESKLKGTRFKVIFRFCEDYVPMS